MVREMKALLLAILLLLPISAMAGEVTAKTTLRRGTLLSDKNISLVQGAGETITSLRRDFIGRELNRTIYAGHVIDIAYVRAPTLIIRNAQISMIYTYGALQLTAKGKALQTGGEGDLISVMNLSSRKKISAIIIGVDRVEVR